VRSYVAPKIVYRPVTFSIAFLGRLGHSLKEHYMFDDPTYKQFVAQFNLSEWKRLCKHRLFLHFLKIDLKTAACIASEALDRPVAYTFPKPAKGMKKTGSSKTVSPSIRAPKLGNHRRFRL